VTEPNPPSPDVPPRFDVQWVFGGIADTLRKQLVALWTREGTITGPDREPKDPSPRRTTAPPMRFSRLCRIWAASIWEIQKVGFGNSALFVFASGA
jgi:hypothetical protein